MTTDLAPLDKTAASVVTVLENAKTWLSTAVEMTGPEEIAAAKAHIRTAETYARELHLSKDIQTDAQEMVRRAEYALGKAIRKGQEEGTVETLSDARVRAGRIAQGQHRDINRVPEKTRLADLATRDDLIGNGAGIAHLSDGVTVEQFEDALTEAREEGNLSRANVVRKVKGVKDGPAPSRAQKADTLADLAAQGYSSRQMCKALGFSRDDAVRELAREYGIEIPADKAINRTRRINSSQVAAQTVTALEGLVMGVDLIDYDAINPAEASQWAASLTDSLRVLNRFARQIKEIAHD